MRRPPKPFVTEYKNPTRRGAKDTFSKEATFKEAASKGSHAREGLAPENPWDSGGDGGYEAALRAADALFSTNRTSRIVVESQSNPPGTEHDERGFSAETGSRLSVLDVAGDGTGEIAREEGRGRILQAIEQPANSLFAAMEVERAPGRRGRKPGSKNKPKVVPATSPSFHPGAQDVGSLTDGGIALFASEELADETRETPDLLRAAAFTLPQLKARRRARSSWVRTTLKPGQRWKRRLPKVAW